MYQVSEAYKTALSKSVITDRITGKITLSDGAEITITDAAVVKNSLKISHELCGNYKIGTFNLGCLKIGIYDDNALGRDFSGAVIEPVYGLKTALGWENVPLGVYRVDGKTVKRKKNAVYFTAYDNGTLFDCPPEKWITQSSGKADWFFNRLCKQCGVEFGGMDEGLPNTEVSLNAKSRQLQSCRDIIMWCASLICAYAVIDRTGALRIISARYATDSDDSSEIIVDKKITAAERKSIYVTDTRAYIKSLTSYCGQNVKNYISSAVQTDAQAAPATYALPKNPMLSELSDEQHDEVNNAWLDFIDGFKQRGITAELYGDPTIDVGDVIRCYGGDIDQRRSVVGLVTSQEWRYRRWHSVVCAAPDLIFNEKQTATSSVSTRSQTEKRIDEAMTTSGRGIHKADGKYSLRPAGYGGAENLGGVYTTGSGIKIDHDGLLSTKYAVYNGGDAYYDEMGSIVLGEGLENVKDSSRDVRTRVCLGSGLKYEYPTDENGNEKLNSYPVAIGLNLGSGMDIDENGNLFVSIQYKNGEGIDIDPDTNIISAAPATKKNLGGVKIGANLLIEDDGRLSTPGYTGLDGITVTHDSDSLRTIRAKVTNGLTISGGFIGAKLGKGLHFSNMGAIDADFTVGDAIVISNDESYKFIHNIEEVLYQDSDYEVLTGAQDCFILNREIVYGLGKTAPNGTVIKSGTTNADDWTTLPDIPFKQDKLYIFDRALYNGDEITAIDLVHVSSESLSGKNFFKIQLTKADGTTKDYLSFNNYGAFSYGMAFVWDNLYPPGHTPSGSDFAFENGCVSGRIAARYKSSSSSAAPYIFYIPSGSTSITIGFASKEEYYAAMGLKTGSIDLADLVDNPESPDGGGTIDTGDKYVSPTVSLERTITDGRGSVKIVVKDVLGTHSSYVYDGDIVKYTSQLINDSGFVARKRNVPFNVVAIPDVESVLLVWEKVNGAGGYIVKSGDGSTQYTEKTIRSNSALITGLTGGKEYSFTVYAAVNSKWYGPSETVFATTYSASTGVLSDETEGDDLPVFDEKEVIKI